MTEEDTSSQSKMLRNWGYFILTGGIAAILLWAYPERQDAMIMTTQSYLVEMALIFPAVMLLMGLFNEWISDEMVVQYLGDRSGLSGVGLSIGLGATPTGPLYVAFPIAADLLKKNARVANVVVFLTAWACLKLPQELVEIQFLGWRFTALRLGLTSLVAVGMGAVIEAVLPEDLFGDSAR